ncbi:MAG: tellurite resistance protein [Epsilonproteobacteria bacterium]|nr:MAG: tellurite resistance protein [Campylobacterota bacterium]RLA65978.1 MAG: tellurite resistance protein [Campylobacterota bacterium]
MKELPSDVNSYKKTNIFSQDDIPAGLLKDHQTKENTWGMIRVIEGEIMYVIGGEEVLLSPPIPGVIEPEVHHHVKVVGPVKFYVEFYK